MHANSCSHAKVETMLHMLMPLNVLLVHGNGDHFFGVAMRRGDLRGGVLRGGVLRGGVLRGAIFLLANLESSPTAGISASTPTIRNPSACISVPTAWWICWRASSISSRTELT